MDKIVSTYENIVYQYCRKTVPQQTKKMLSNIYIPFQWEFFCKILEPSWTQALRRLDTGLNRALKRHAHHQ